MMEERFLVGRQEVESMRAEPKRQYSNNPDFIPMAWGGAKDKVNIHKPGATWKVLLRDGEGELLNPGKIPSQMECVGEKTHSTCLFVPICAKIL